MRRNRRGFTLVEILIAVGVIAVLASLLFFAFGPASRAAKGNTTVTTLQTLRGMLTEYEVNGGSMTALEQAYSVPVAPDVPVAFKLKAPAGSVSAEAPDRNSVPVNLTRAVMAQLLAVPDNKKALDNLPRDVVWSDASGVVALLDGFNNPIIYVPRNGMTGVNLGKKPEGSSPPFAKMNQTIVNPGSTTAKPRGYFVSAGDDGNFSQGDDNHYSFEQ